MSEITEEVKESLTLVEDLKFFLATAPANWQENQVIRRYYLNNDEGFVSCVFWNNLYFITGTDIVRCILYKFQHFGRTVTDRKKFEEGIFSDLRNLKSGTDAVLENPKLEFLEFLYKNSCLRTQKKQKVFFWFNVPHDKLMADALERDIKKEKANQTPTSVALREPALLFNYIEDKMKTLYEQLSEHLGQLKFERQEPDNGNDNSNTNTDESLEAHDYSTSSGSVVPQKHTSDTSYTGQGQGSQFLDHTDHPDRIEEGVDEDDDFPLDYVDNMFSEQAAIAGPDWAGRDYADRDYITLDTHHGGLYASANYNTAFEPDFDHLDASVFQNSVNVVSNDDYLIEQTVPLRLGNLFSPSQLFYPRLAKFYDEQAYMHQPMSFGGVGPQFPPYAYELLQAYYQQDAAVMFPQTVYDNEHLHPQLTPIHSMVHLEANGQVYGYPEDLETFTHGGFPSQRQQEVSSSMLRKRRQLLSTHRPPLKVGKPPRGGGNSGSGSADYESKFRVQIKKEDDFPAHVPMQHPSIHISTYDGDSHHQNKGM